jgi:hypothetical protein
VEQRVTHLASLSSQDLLIPEAHLFSRDDMIIVIPVYLSGKTHAPPKVIWKFTSANEVNWNRQPVLKDRVSFILVEGQHRLVQEMVNLFFISF